MQWIRYDADQSESRGCTDARALPEASDTGTLWIHVQGHPDDETLAVLGERFGLHPLAMEDIHNTGQRPKVEDYDEHLFVILSLPRFTDETVQIDQTSLCIGDGFVVSFCEGPQDPFEPVRKRLQQQSSKLRKLSSDYLAYTLMDIVIDQGFPVLEAFGNALEDVEEDVVDRPRQDTLVRIHRMKRELILLRRTLWPHREIFNVLTSPDRDLMHQEISVYLRDCRDHAIQIMDLLETYRDMSVSLLDIYLSSVSNRMNDIMRTLTVIATIFIPLTFIVGLYGMNFGRHSTSPWAMPELDWYYGYPLVLLFMALLVTGMLLWFRHRRWL